MSSIALLLLTLSAMAHASWNLFGKQAASAGLAFYWLTSLVAAILSLPLLYYFSAFMQGLPFSFWLLVLATGISQVVYFSGLAGTYRFGAFALSYPLARALPVVLVPVGSIIFLHSIPSLAAGIGIVIVMLAMLLLLRSEGDTGQRHLAILFAVIAAAGTVGYSLIDFYALSLLRQLYPQHAPWHLMLFYAACQACATLLIISFMLCSRQQRAKCRQASIQHAKTAVLAGLVIFVTYGLVMLSFMFVSNVSYVVAFRQLSIPIGILLAVIFLKETVSARIAVSNLLLLCGLLMVVLNGGH